MLHSTGRCWAGGSAAEQVGCSLSGKQGWSAALLSQSCRRGLGFSSEGHGGWQSSLGGGEVPGAPD